MCNVTLDPIIICEGDSALLTVDGITGIIQWQENISTTGIWQNTGTGNDTLVVSPNDSESPIDYRVVVVNDVICYDTSNIQTLTVLERVVAGTIDPITDTICSGSDITITMTGGIGSIQWQELINNTWTNIVDDTSNATTQNLTTSDTITIFNYRATITNGVCGDTSDISMISVYPNVDMNIAITGPDTICEGSINLYAIVDSTGGGGNPLFTWFIDNATVQTGGSTYTIPNTLTSGDHDVRSTYEI